MLKDLLDEDSVNMKAVESKLKQIESLETDIHLSRIKTLEAIKTKLTPDQRKKLREMRDQGMMGRSGMIKRNGCGMMGEMKGGMMHHENMEKTLPPSGSNEEMPEMEHN